MKKTFLLLSISFLVVGTLSSVSAAMVDTPEIPCNSVGITSTTDQCFHGPTVYQSGSSGIGFIADDFVSYSSNPILWYPKDPEGGNGFSYDYQALQSSTSWYLDEPSGSAFYFPPSINDWLFNKAGIAYRTWDPGARKRLVENKPGTGLRLTSVSAGADRNKPAFRLTFTTRHFNTVWNGTAFARDKANPVTHKEHTFFYPAWCGDGVVDAKFGETCDAGTENGKPGQCNTSCNGNTPPSPVAGACGGANSTATATMPTTNLCTSGVATAAILANGTYSWSCTGQNGGATASCTAPQKTDAMCGTDAGKVMSTLPTNLCSIGTPTSVSGVGPWSWSCTGQNGGATASCTASTTPLPPPQACDQYFTGTLRVGKNYSFPDYYSNNNLFARTIQGFNVDFNESDDMNADTKLSGWNFTWATGMSPGVSIPGNSTDVKILEANPRYFLITPPKSGRKSNNISIKYSLNTDGQGGPRVHNECIDYAVSWCGDGVVDTDRAETCDAGAENGQPGKCNVKCNGTTPPPESPVCSTSVTGPQTAPITTGACNKGTVSGFLATDIGNAVNYTWSCNNSTAPAMNCSASYQKPIEKPFAIKLKKYVDNDTQDAQPGNEIAMSAGQTFNYVIRVTNLGEGTVKSTTTVADTLPTGVELNGNISGSLWTCKVTGRTIACTTEATPGANTSFADIIVPVKVVATTGTITNTAVVANVNDSNGPADNTDPAVIKIGSVAQPNLIIKKSVNGIDAQTQSSAVMVGSGETYNYNLDVKNIGSSTILGAKVTDTMPVQIEIVSTPIGTDWTCTISGQNITCLYNKSLAVGASAPTITVPSRIRSTVLLGTKIRNVAAVCVRDPSLPTTDPANNCTTDENECKPGDLDYDPATGKCDPVVVVKGDVYLSIKKYAGDKDGQISTDALPVVPGKSFTYKYVISNTGSQDAINVVQTDALPQYITLDSFVTPLPEGWSCSKGEVTEGGYKHATMICKTSKMAAKSSITIWANVKLEASTPSTVTELRNISYVCKAGDAPTATCDPECLDPNNPECTQPPVDPKCSAIPTDPHYDPACINVVGEFDLSIKKYVNTDATDAQSGSSAYSTTNGATLNYVIRVKNEGPASTSGLTTVKDILPTGISATGTVTGAGWTCAYASTNSGALTCTTSAVVASGATFSDITIPVVVKTTAGTSVTNYALVHNPSETNPCSTDNSMPSGSEGSCAKDPKNVDPAVISVSGCTSNCGTTSTKYYIPKCIDNKWVNTESVNETLALCNDANHPYTCQTSPDTRSGQSCTPGPCVPGDPRCTPVDPGICGDGFINLAAGEECDTKNDLSCIECKRIDTSECSLDANGVKKIIIKGASYTCPGANPYHFSLSIPGLTKSITSSFGDRIIPFHEHKIIVGSKTNVFTLADKVNLDIQRQYPTLTILPFNKKVCLKGNGDAVNNDMICNTFGNMDIPADRIVRLPAGTYLDDYGHPATIPGNFVTFGTGYYMSRDTPGSLEYTVHEVLNGSTSGVIFKGSGLYPRYVVSQNGTADEYTLNRSTPSQVTLRDTFLGQGAGTTGYITLYTVSSNDGVTAYSMASGGNVTKFPVYVSKVLLGGTAGGTNRQIQTYAFADNSIATFLSGFTPKTTTTITTNTTSAVAKPPVVNVNVPGVTAPPTAIPDQANLIANYKVNGNPNILAIKGNVSLCTPPTGTSANSFIVDGVRTLIVEGDLTINCNIGYQDGAASWAIIVKGGNIIIDKSVASLAGVYVTIPVGTIGGKFTQATPTNTILRLEGSMYGNPDELFQKRLYVRGTSAYDILTTGVILTYSNRALVNPPPLLSEYLNNYSVTKVAK